MSINKLALFFFIILISSCKSSSSIVDTELVERLETTNTLLFELLISNSNIDDKQINYLKEISKINSTSNVEIETQFENLLNGISKIDKGYFKSEDFKKEVRNKFSSLSKEEKKSQVILVSNKFLEYLVRKSDFEMKDSDNDIFLTIVPASFKVKPNEKFKADVILAKKVKTIEGKLTLNNYSNKFTMKEGVYHFAETNSSKDEFSKRNLEFQFATKINGRDIILKAPYTYIIEK